MSQFQAMISRMAETKGATPEAREALRQMAKKLSLPQVASFGSMIQLGDALYDGLHEAPQIARSVLKKLEFDPDYLDTSLAHRMLLGDVEIAVGEYLQQHFPKIPKNGRLFNAEDCGVLDPEKWSDQMLEAIKGIESDLRHSLAGCLYLFALVGEMIFNLTSAQMEKVVRFIDEPLRPLIPYAISGLYGLAWKLDDAGYV